MKRYALVLALVMALAAGFGCAKKTSSEPGYSSDMSPEMRAAKQQIEGNKVYFAFDSYKLDSKYKPLLQTQANLMKQYPSFRVQIQGHCDERGTQEYNLALGERRARVVYDHLSTLGVNPGQMEMISYGKEMPAVQGSGQSVWQQNRRDEFRVVGH